MLATQGNVVTSSAQIADGIIVDADINAAAGIQKSKLGALAIVDADVSAHTTTKISTPISLLTNPGGAQGDVAIWNGANWVRLAAGTSGQFLKTLGGGANPAWGNASGKQFSAAGTVTIQNTIAETNIFTFSLPGGTLGTTGVLLGRVVKTGIVGSAGAITWTYRLYYGATVIATGNFSSGSGGNAGEIRFAILANGATNAQTGDLVLQFGDDGALTTTTDFMLADSGSAAVDSTAAQTVKLTLQMSVAGASYGGTFANAVVWTP